ncbi:hypothetical protein [Undibacterium sp. Ren11W]|uniref:hypothetical protein n=1 Tax=Undibacterium sp. Ren11W TaxID=3413045 RepID=UPI003BF079E2
MVSPLQVGKAGVRTCSERSVKSFSSLALSHNLTVGILTLVIPDKTWPSAHIPCALQARHAEEAHGICASGLL